MPIRTVILDFGNVVAFFDHGRAIARLDEFTNMDPVELALILYGSPIEDAYERDAIDTDEYVREALLNGRLTCTKEQFLAAFVDIFWCNDEVCALIPRLKPKYRVMLASNTNAAHYAQYVKQFKLELAPIDHIGTSVAAKARKPESAFYESIQQFAQCEPGECLFLDDLPTNVEAAEKFGWRGVVYRTGGSLADKLRAAGVEVGTTT